MFLRNFRKDKSGVAAIEIAIALPLLILLLVGLLEFGLYFLKTQIALNALGTTAISIQQNPGDDTVQVAARASGSSFMDLENAPNFFCAQAYPNFNAAQAGLCTGRTWSTAAPSGTSGSYYVALRLKAKKISVGLVSSFLSDIDRTQIVKVDQTNCASGMALLNTVGTGATWTVPACVTAVKATIVAAGAAGCGGAGLMNGYKVSGAGGGGGGAIVAYLTNLTPSSTISYVVGTGGTQNISAAGNPKCTGALSGGNTTFNGLTAGGGRVGSNPTGSEGVGGTGGKGGTSSRTQAPSSGNLVLLLVQDGAPGFRADLGPGNSVDGGYGGASGGGYGTGGQGGQDNDQNGNPQNGGDGYNGGGGGGSGSHNTIGGKGGNGLILLEW